MSNVMDSLVIKRRGTIRSWRRRAIALGVVCLVALIGLYMTWEAFFVYVPPGKHLVLIANSGDPLPEDAVLAEPGQKGIQRHVEGEGWHFVMPIAYDTVLEANTEVPPGQIGIVNARGGKELTGGRVVAGPGERGIQAKVLTPGTYRINLHGYEVKLVDAIQINPGMVGVQQRLLGDENQGRFADERKNEKGILRNVLQPGLYFINPYIYKVIPSQIGIFQTTFRHDADPESSVGSAIGFTSKAGFNISMDCTVEWEVQPNDMPLLVAEYGSRDQIELKVIDTQAHAIGRDTGVRYGVQSFLEGTKREEFQTEFAKELTDVCAKKNVTVRSAFIRDMLIPEVYLQPIREKQIAAETELTNKAWEATRESEAEMEREMQLVQQRVQSVEADTKKIVAEIDQEVENLTIRREAEIEKLDAEYQAKIATLDSKRIQRIGEAKAGVTKQLETARSSLYKMKMDVFERNGDAFLRYTLAQNLNPNLVLRLFQSGPGTFWTNLGNKDFNMMLPAGPGALIANPNSGEGGEQRATGSGGAATPTRQPAPAPRPAATPSTQQTPPRNNAAQRTPTPPRPAPVE